MTAIIIHLSDAHFQEHHHAAALRHEKIAATIRPVLSSAQAVFLVWTGDIVHSGTKPEFEIAQTFIKNLINEIKKDHLGPIETILTPGNHDGNFLKSKSTRSGIIEQIISDPSKAEDEDYIAACVEPLKEYFEFQNSISNNGVSYDHPLWRDYRFDISGKSIRFSAMNASWITTPKQQVPLVFPIDKFLDHYQDSASVNILLIHHPLNWYAQHTYHPLRKKIQSYYQIVMSGHEHQGNQNILSDFSSRSVILLECPALDTKKGDAFSVAILDIEKMTIATEKLSWKGDLYEPQNKLSPWSEHKSIPELRPRNGVCLTDYVRQTMESMDASFLHPDKEHLTLSDVFVYPEIIETNTDSENTKPKSAECLLSNKSELNKVILFGDEQYGRTSLLKQLFLEMYHSGQMPLLISAHEGDGTPDQFTKMINRKVEDFYGTDAIVRHAQARLDDKVILVDDLDQIGERGDVVARLIRNLESQFGKIIISAAERYEFAIIHSQEASAATTDYSQYKILGFGYKLRYDLIRRWYAIGYETAADFQARVNDAERIINTVLGKGLVPMTAFNTLVLLQSIQINENQALVNAGMAQYYEFMLRQALFHAKVPVSDYDEIQNYITQLAWQMYSSKNDEINIYDLAIFHKEYSEEFFKTDLTKRLSLLERAKILNKNGESYSFAYSYLKFFFVAKYLALNCNEQEDLIKHLCNHLYLRENANIILFLTYNISSEWVIKEIAGILNQILIDIPPLNITNDSATLNDFVRKNAKLVVDTSNIVENNRKLKEAEDSGNGRINDHEQKHEVSSISELDGLSQINLLFKTCEILGQILKGRYGSIKNKTKEDLMKRLFDAPLRCVSLFHQTINDEPEGIVSEIIKILQKSYPKIGHERATQISKRLLFQLMGAISDSYFSRQGEIIGSAKLIDTIDKVASTSNEPTYKIVSIAAKLSIPNYAPTEDIKKLSHELEGNYFGKLLLQGLVARHLYMFHLPISDRNSLASAVGIDIKEQRGIELRSQNSKKLPGKLYQPKRGKPLLTKLQQCFERNNPLTKKIEDRYTKKKIDKI